jgi:hypothetical protein
MFLRKFVLLATFALISVGVPPAAAATTGSGPITCPEGGETAHSFPAGTKIKGDVVVPPGVNCYLLDVTVKGDVRAEANAASLVADFATVIKGDVSATNVPSVVLQNTQINGSVQLQNITDVASLNGPVIRGEVEITYSNIVILVSSVVNADIALAENQVIIVGENIIRGTLACVGNVTVEVQPSTVRGGALGQCAGS